MVLACWLFFGVLGLSRTVEADTNLIAYVNGEGELYIIQPNGEGKRKLASGEMLQAIKFSPQQTKAGQDFYTWPVWSPDGSRVACFRVLNGEHGPTDGYTSRCAQTPKCCTPMKNQSTTYLCVLVAGKQNLAVLLGGPEAFSVGCGRLAVIKNPRPSHKAHRFIFIGEQIVTLLACGRRPGSESTLGQPH